MNLPEHWLAWGQGGAMTNERAIVVWDRIRAHEYRANGWRVEGPFITPRGAVDPSEVEELRRFKEWALRDAPEWEKANAMLKHRVRELKAELADHQRGAVTAYQPQCCGNPDPHPCNDCPGAVR